MELIKVEAQKRTGTGKSVARKLRREGLVPGVVYGMDREPEIVAVRREVVERLERLYGQQAEPVHMYAAVKGDTASATGIGLYVQLPENWRWMSSPHPNMLLAQRSFMPWTVHIAAVGIPGAVRLEDVMEQYLSGTMLYVMDKKPVRVGATSGEAVEAEAAAGDEVAHYRIVFVRRSGLLVVMTFAAPRRWWEMAEAEFDAILGRSALALRP